MRTGAWVAAVFVLVAAAPAAPQTAGVGAPISARVAQCRRAAQIGSEEVRRLSRFFPLGGAYVQWPRLDCYPARLDDAALAQAASATGFVVTVGAGDAFVVELGSRWLDGCAATGAPAKSLDTVTGADLLALKQSIERHPRLSHLDLREIGLGRARTREGKPLYALYLGTLDRSVFLECFDDPAGALARAAQALPPAAQ